MLSPFLVTGIYWGLNCVPGTICGHSGPSCEWLRQGLCINKVHIANDKRFGKPKLTIQILTTVEAPSTQTMGRFWK